MKKLNFWILAILLIGLVFRIYLSSGGNFIFNMDNARDMVDIREMVVLGKLRLIGQTTAIEGVYYGPAWYYILSIPFILSGGNPYASILTEILLWFMGGYFLLMLVNKFYGKLATLAVGCIWVASNFILLGTQYAFNPNPILFLTPIFIFCLWKFLETGKWIFNILAFLLGGLFLHFEIAVGIFMPFIIILTIIFSQKWNFLKDRRFYLGPVVFLSLQLPQIIFELRHNFFMAKALLTYKSGSHGEIGIIPVLRTQAIFKSFYDTFLPTLMNFEFFTKAIIFIFIITILWLLKVRGKIDKLTLICLVVVFTTLLGLIPLKVDLMRWHLNSVLIASIVLVGFVIYYLQKFWFGKIVAGLLFLMMFIFTTQNITSYVQVKQKGDGNNSILKNEISAIDYTYQKAAGKNFKVYVYLPSVIDYPYQYLYWWHGLKKYGYLPEDYAYLPDKPEYIKQKEKFDTGKKPESSNLVFLIKEPDQIGQRHLWENSFKNLKLLEKTSIGSLDIEIRKE